jgi:hypothetical protein
VPRRDQDVDQRFVPGIECVIERAEVIVPLHFGARAGDHRTDQPIVEHPVERELAGSHAALFRVRLDALRADQRLFAKFGFQQTPVAYLPVSTPRASGLYGTMPRP